MAHRHVNVNIKHKLSDLYNAGLVALEGGHRFWSRMKRRSDIRGGNYGASERDEKMESVSNEDKDKDKDNIKAILDTNNGDIDDEEFGDPKKISPGR